MMQEPVKGGRGEDLVTERLSLFAEGLARGEDDRALLVVPGDHLSHRVRLSAFEGLVADSSTTRTPGRR